MEKLDYKKKYKELYLPKTKPSIVEVPEMIFFAVEGQGDPNTCVEYKTAMEILYGLSFTIKMSKMNNTQPDGYFEYTVPPLEGLWYCDEVAFDGVNVVDKSKFRWLSMIRQPEFVTNDVFENAKRTFSKKKPELPLDKAKFMRFEEGLCVQIMHIGDYDSENESIEKMRVHLNKLGYAEDFSEERWHHEIYLSDPRRCAREKLKTVIRHPIVKVI